MFVYWRYAAHSPRGCVGLCTSVRAARPARGLSACLGSDQTLLAQSICRFASEGLCSRSAESGAHAAFCRGGTSSGRRTENAEHLKDLVDRSGATVSIVEFLMACYTAV